MRLAAESWPLETGSESGREAVGEAVPGLKVLLGHLFRYRIRPIRGVTGEAAFLSSLGPGPERRAQGGLNTETQDGLGDSPDAPKHVGEAGTRKRGTQGSLYNRLGQPGRGRPQSLLCNSQV